MLKLEKTFLTLDLDQPSTFHYVWLRDNCACADCIHPEMQERILITHSIPADIAPKSAHFDDDVLEVTWNHEDHKSRYSRSWLAAHNYTASRFDNDVASGQAKLWGSEIGDSIPSFDYSDLLDNDNILLAWCEAIRDVGLAIVRGALQESGEIERFANHVAFVRETIYDRIHTVRATRGDYQSYNVASTSLELKPHTDMPNHNNPPGVQMFHFIANDCEGGESTAVDGFKVAANLKQQDPAAYDLLSRTPIHFKIDSPRGDLQARKPLLTHDVDGRLSVFRFSNQVAQPANLPVDQMEAFYDAYRKLGKLVEDPANMVEFRLNSGDMMATNNLRVMHGRRAFDPNSGDRHLQLCYMDMDDVLSRIRMLKNTQAA